MSRIKIHPWYAHNHIRAKAVVSLGKGYFIRQNIFDNSGWLIFKKDTHNSGERIDSKILDKGWDAIINYYWIE